MRNVALILLSVYLRHSYDEESIVQPKHVYYVVFAMSSQPYPTVIDTRIFVIGLVICCRTVFRIQSVDKVSIVFSTEFVSISFAETNNIGAFTQFTLHIYVIYVNTQWGWDKMAAISQTTLPNAFSWMKMLEYRLRFHRGLFIRVQLIIFQHWFR